MINLDLTRGEITAVTDAVIVIKLRLERNATTSADEHAGLVVVIEKLNYAGSKSPVPAIDFTHDEINSISASTQSHLEDMLNNGLTSAERSRNTHLHLLSAWDKLVTTGLINEDSIKIVNIWTEESDVF